MYSVTGRKIEHCDFEASTGHIGKPPRQMAQVTPTAVDALVCLLGGEHRWVSKGNRVRCTKCQHSAAKRLIPALKLASTEIEEIEVADPNSIPACTNHDGHHWHSDGAARGKPRARCAHCKVSTARLPRKQNRQYIAKRKYNEMPECTDSAGHNFKRNGKDAYTGKTRMKCLNCKRTRNAVDGEAG